jgi:hypothetical protein
VTDGTCLYFSLPVPVADCEPHTWAADKVSWQEHAVHMCVSVNDLVTARVCEICVQMALTAVTCCCLGLTFLNTLRGGNTIGPPGQGSVR